MAMQEVSFHSSRFRMFAHTFSQAETGPVRSDQLVYNLSLKIGKERMLANIDFGRRMSLVAGVVGPVGAETGQYGYTLFDPMARKVLLHMEGKFEERLAGAEGIYFKTDESKQTRAQGFTLQRVGDRGKVRMCSGYNGILIKHPGREHLISYRPGALVTNVDHISYFSPFLIGFMQAQFDRKIQREIDERRIMVDLIYSLTDGIVLQAYAQASEYRYSLPYFPFSFNRLAPKAQFPTWEVPLGSDPFTRDTLLQQVSQT